MIEYYQELKKLVCLSVHDEWRSVSIHSVTLLQHLWKNSTNLT